MKTPKKVKKPVIVHESSEEEAEVEEQSSDVSYRKIKIFKNYPLF